MVLSETLTETIPVVTDEVDRVSLIALDDFLPYPVPEDEKSGEHYVEEKKTPHRLSTIADYSQIYCQGELLDLVQRSGVFPNDSKQFVDLKLKYSEEDILRDFQTLLKNVPNPDRSTLLEFVNYHFEEGKELEVWSPPDFTPTPSIYNRVTDPKYKQWTLDLNNIWKDLGRKVKQDVADNPKMYSLVHTPNGFVIPGGRFTELYYWDSYWILQGILLCDMKQTAKGIVENIIYIVEKFGFMPNGARVYYLGRSQPPLLILMAATYVKATGDPTFIKKHIKSLTTEFEYWMTNHLVTVEKNNKYYKLARFYAPSAGPRPESYREDFELAEHLLAEERDAKYGELKAGAESGWDFSGRWFINKDGSNKGNLSHIKTTQILPVDLNAILQTNAFHLYIWHQALGNKELADRYRKIAKEFQDAIQSVLWNEEAGVWLDYDMLNKKPRNYFYISNFTPLWTRSYKKSGSQIAARVLAYLRANHLSPEDRNYKFYGTPQSLDNTSQQWDYPNAWAPSQGILIQGLDYTGDRAAQDVARKLADIWVRANYVGYVKFKAMFEKYSVILEGDTGRGGEYAAQTGFGWTNGVIFEFLEKYGKTLSYDKDYADFTEENVIPDV